jgi:hypothetical protein
MIRISTRSLEHLFPLHHWIFKCLRVPPPQDSRPNLHSIPCIEIDVCTISVRDTHVECSSYQGLVFPMGTTFSSNAKPNIKTFKPGWFFDQNPINLVLAVWKWIHRADG